MQTWLDKSISYLSPMAGLRRAQARRALGVVNRLGYEGAKVGRRTVGWNASGTSANTEIGQSLTMLRDRARQLVRDNPHARKAVGEIVSNLVGTGVTAKITARSEALTKKVAESWREWTKQCDADGQLNFGGLQRLAARAMVESGEALVRLRPRRTEDALHIPLQLQVIEPDYLDHGKNMPTQNGGYIIHGVEFDPLGRRVAYWLFDQHPGDSITLLTRAKWQSRRIPAESVLHIYEKDRAGQVRGVTQFSSVLMKMRDLDEYEEAELVRKKIEACFAGFVTQPEGPDGAGIAAQGTDEAGNRTETFEPGMIEYLRPGEEIAFGAPASAAGYRDYTAAQDAAIAAGLQLTYEQLTGDLSRVNYSSYRAGHLSFRNTIEQMRWLTFAPMFLDQVWQRVNQTAQIAGVWPDLGMAEPVWGFPGFGSVDPYKDAMAAMINRRIGKSTLGQIVTENGEEFAEQMAALKAENEVFDQLGLTLDCDPRKVSKTGLLQAD